MAENVTFTINFGGNAIKNAKELTTVTGKLQAQIESVRSSAEEFARKMVGINQTIQAFQGAISSFNELSKAGMQLETSMSELGALTGLTADKLRLIEKYAKESATTFGGSGADSVESYKLILSQLSPEIAKVPEALAAMGKNISTLSKTMGGDVTGAAQVLTAAMNQYKVSLDDPMAASEEMARMMNVMAAAAQAGSAEMPSIKATLKQ